MSRLTTSSEQRSSDGSSQEPSAPVAQGRRWFMGAAAATVGGFLLGQLLPIRRPAGPGSEPVPADVGMLYHQWSTPGHRSQAEAITDWGEQPERYKTYSQAKQIALPDPSGYGGPTLEDTVLARRSRREYAGQSLSLEGLSRLLYAAQGITDPQTQHRAAPSAGALYPIEVYLAVQDVSGLDSGIYHYAVQTHALELLRQGDFRQSVMEAGVGQAHLGNANVCFILSAIFQRTRWKYRQRTYRYLLLEAGHIGQNLCLAATAMGLGACPVGAFLDDDLNALLGLDGQNEAALYILATGVV